MNTSQLIGRNSLVMAIANITAIHSRLTSNPDNYREEQLMYALKGVLMELNQYFGGGFFEPDYVQEKCEIIGSLARGIRAKDLLGAGGE